MAEILMPTGKPCNLKDYQQTYDNFSWDEVASQFSWSKTGKINMAYEAIDKHVEEGHGNDIALHFINDNITETYTYRNLMKNSNKIANVLVNDAHVTRGDRVFIFMPRSPESACAMLGIMKIGALACPIFEAFMERAVYERVYDCSAKVLITTIDMLYRIPIDQLPDLETIYIASDYVGTFKEPFIHALKPLVFAASDEFEVQFVEENDPMLLCYTSGSTGKPKGILLSHKGVMMQAYQTGKFVLDLQPDDVYWCTADPGWVTGAVYSLLTPWLHGIQAILAGGRFKAENWYRNLQDYKVTVWYSAPTALRLLMSSDPSIARRFDISSVRNIYSVGEPLNPEVIRWAMAEFGIRVHDTWFMTETGSQMVCNYPCMPIKPGSMGKPIPGVVVDIFDNHNKPAGNNIMGTLVVKKGWPSMMNAVWGSEEKYNSYFVGENNEWYSSGDTAYRDDDGYYWYQGRIDDVINTSGERVGPFEVESKLLEHPAVIEAGVIGIPDPTRGQIIKAFVTLSDGFVPSDELKKELRDFVKLGLAAHAAPREFAFCDSLPKTRSGKIMRRVLKARELGLPEGDLSSMDDD